MAIFQSARQQIFTQQIFTRQMLFLTLSQLKAYWTLSNCSKSANC